MRPSKSHEAENRTVAVTRTSPAGVPERPVVPIEAPPPLTDVLSDVAPMDLNAAAFGNGSVVVAAPSPAADPPDGAV
jgi:hypothetical protein